MLEEQIKTSNESNIKTNLNIIGRYSRVIHTLVIISKILIILSGLFSFASTRFETIWILNFASGSLNFLATSLLSYSGFLQIEKKKITKQLNHKLEVLGIKEKLLESEVDSDKSV